MPKSLNSNFFSRPADVVAAELLGKVLCRKLDGKILRARIVETEAYFGEDDPASRASKGENKVSKMMREKAGKILIYNVHRFKMLNFVTGSEGEPSAVLIRAIEPLNFKARTAGPGLLTSALKIDDSFHGKHQHIDNLLWVEDEENKENLKVERSFRIGVREDLNIPLRFYIKGNKFVSKTSKK